MLKTLLAGSAGQASMVQFVNWVYQILKCRTMPELAYHVLKALEKHLDATYCQKDCQISLGLLPDQEQVLSIFRVGVPHFQSPCSCQHRYMIFLHAVVLDLASKH